MDKRYQVFVSSTLKDLGDARQTAFASMIRMKCFPSAMEYFSAASVAQFEYIKEEIEQSDWVVCILAGKYGSIHPDTGVGYTEMEYDYAMKIGKPVIRLLHRSPETELLASQTENTDELVQKLASFRKKLTESHLVAFWSNSSELGSELIMGLLYLKRNYPSGGWVRAKA